MQQTLNTVDSVQDMQQEKKEKAYVLFGGEADWKTEDWTSSDDSVRGGKSESHLECKDKTGRFYGNLDTKTLGGAGFASQRTTGDDRVWDLHKYAAIQIAVKKGDKKRYTLILKDTLLPPNPRDGREQSTISYECDFELPPQAQPGDATNRVVTIPFASLNPTYRGRLKKDAKAIDLSKVRRISIMMRSFFGAQEGDFSLTLLSIAAVTSIPSSSSTPVSLASAEYPKLPDSSALEKGYYQADVRDSVLSREEDCGSGVDGGAKAIPRLTPARRIITAVTLVCCCWLAWRVFTELTRCHMATRC